MPVLTAGAPLAEASGAVVLIHGRGATAESILSLAQPLDRPAFAYLAPQAAGYQWYPQGFMAPIEANEPYLTSALETVAEVLRHLEEAGVPLERVVLAGFSQGACLASEYVARNARRYGGLAALSGGLIGPAGTPRDYPGSLGGTPAFLGCSDRDPHIPLERVQETTRVLSGLGARVTERIYPGMGHTVNEDEIDAVRAILDEVAA